MFLKLYLYKEMWVPSDTSLEFLDNIYDGYAVQVTVNCASSTWLNDGQKSPSTKGGGRNDQPHANCPPLLRCSSRCEPDKSPGRTWHTPLIPATGISGAPGQPAQCAHGCTVKNPVSKKKKRREEKKGKQHTKQSTRGGLEGASP